MLNTTKCFILSLFEIFIVYIVLGNFLGWSGGAPSITGYSYSWDNSYIGFESLFTMVNDFSNMIDEAYFVYNNTVYHVADMKAFLFVVKELTTAITFGIPKLITALTNNTFNALLIIDLLITFFLQPLIVGAWTILAVLIVLYWAFSFVVVFLKFCGGAYNVQFTNTNEVWDEWSSVASEWSFAVPVI